MDVLARYAKRTALLAYLAAALPRGPHRRDTLLALFWSESDASHARAALSQALYVLRTALGDEAIVSRGDGDVSVNGDVVWCDAAAFEAALDAGRPGDALALYRGDLLEGFFVTGAPEFERWLDGERARLRERASQGARALAEERASAGDTLEAERWARRAAELLPADEAVARRLIAFLHRLGDRAAAIRAYEEFAARLAQDYELEPSAETQALAAGIREEEIRPRVRQHVESAVPADTASRGSNRAPGRWRVGLSRRRAAAVLAAVAGSLLAGGWFLAWTLRARSVEATRTPKRLVVLPFANLGPAEQEYFADGITEEIAARLAVIDPLRIIGRTSAGRYKRTTKTLQEIGRELGVSYVLEGAVRWEKSPQGQARVRVTPQLVSTADGAHLWAQVYDEPLDEIFRVQSDIAQKVVQALDVTLFEPQRRALDAAPTENIEAYDYYLRGNNYMNRPLTQAFTRAAIQMYQKAITLDPRFALAYARLSRVYSRMYWLYYDPTQNRLDEAKRAVDRALELQPDLPAAHHSLGTYYWLGYGDFDRALREFAIAESKTPNDINLVTARAVLHERQGDFAAAFEDFDKAHHLDPVSPWIALNYGEARDLVRDFARADSLFSHVIAVSPDWPYPYFLKAALYLRWRGSTQDARAVLQAARTAHADGDDLFLLARVWVETFVRRYGQALGHLSAVGVPEVSYDQFRFIPRTQMLAQVYGLLGRHDRERVYYDSARAFVLSRMRAQPDDPRFHSALGVAYAGLGRKADAIREGLRGVELIPTSKDTYKGYYRAWDLARIYTMVGESDAAVGQLEQLLSMPGHLTAAWLRRDPTWDPLRRHPRFQRLLDPRK